MSDTPVSNGWTGGQYSLCRALLGICLCLRSLSLLPHLPAQSTSPAAVTALIVIAAALSILLTVGWYDAFAALGIVYIGGVLASQHLIGNPGLVFLGGLLLIHVLVPPAPFGSWAGRGRVDPSGGWHMPPTVVDLLWLALPL